MSAVGTIIAMVAVGAIALGVAIGLSELYDWLRDRWIWKRELAERERQAARQIEEITYRAQVAILTEAMRRAGVNQNLTTVVDGLTVGPQRDELDR